MLLKTLVLLFNLSIKHQYLFLNLKLSVCTIYDYIVSTKHILHWAILKLFVTKTNSVKVVHDMQKLYIITKVTTNPRRYFTTKKKQILD